MGGRRRAWRVGLLVLVVASGAACGTWRTTSRPAPINAAHVALLRTGKVLLVAGSGADELAFNAGSFKTSLWDPETETFTSVATPWDAFCSGHAFMADGRMLVAGGTSAFPATENGRYAGTNKAYMFNPTTSRYEAAPNSAIARWYPTVVELGDGRLLTVGGFDENKKDTRDFEIFDGTSWSAPKAPPALMPFMPTYPALHLMRDGRLFFSGASVLGSRTTSPGLWNIETNAYQKVPNLPKKALRDEGMSVLLPPAQDQRVLILGGGRTLSSISAVSSAAIADMSQAVPKYKPTRSMGAAKLYVSAVILPDSTVLQTGGAASAQDNGTTPVFSSQIFDPKTKRWSDAATHKVPRVYHSSALLLPDGRVATFGGNPAGAWEQRVEIYSPPYLETGTPRPQIRTGPVEIRYGNSYTFGTAQSSDLKSAVLVRPASVTHSSDSNQRLVDLPFTRTAGGLTVSVTNEPNLAPPGWYMMFVVDSNGVPSVAKWVHLA